MKIFYFNKEHGSILDELLKILLDEDVTEEKSNETTKDNTDIDTSYRFGPEELRKRYNTVSNIYNDASNVKKEEFEEIVKENLEKASNSVTTDEDLAKYSNVSSTTTVYPDPKKYKILVAKTKSGKRCTVYEVMDIDGMIAKSLVYVSKEGERL